MTTDTQLVPTDAELESLAARMLSIHSRYWDETNAFARAVLARWGQPVRMATKIRIPTYTMEHEFHVEYLRGFEAGKTRAAQEDKGHDN